MEVNGTFYATKKAFSSKTIIWLVLQISIAKFGEKKIKWVTFFGSVCP